MTNIRDIDAPLTRKAELVIKSRDGEVFTPKEMYKELKGESPSSIRSALRTLWMKDEIARLELSHTSVYYGTAEAIEELKRRVLE